MTALKDLRLFTWFEGHRSSADGVMSGLREDVRRLEDLGADGVLAGDHMFDAGGGDRSKASRGYDPLTLLATIGGISDRLVLGTIVANVSWIHPAHLLRHFAELAYLFGGDRVLAGLGGGWNAEEFDAIAFEMPRHAERMRRLEVACQLARGWFDSGIATVDGVARDLPRAPLPETPPQLLLSGGSNRLLELAGRYADVLDLGAPPSLGPGEEATLSCSLRDLETSLSLVARNSAEAERPLRESRSRSFRFSSAPKPTWPRLRRGPAGRGASSRGPSRAARMC